MTLVVVGVLAFALVTDLRAHARARHERQDLASARTTLSASRFDLRATTYTRGLATNHRDSLRSSVAMTLGQLTTTQGTLTTTDTTAYLQGLDVKTLQWCLSGVQGAYQQVSAHDKALATGDISVASNACLTVDSGGDSGLVYPFDFPDPFVLRVGGTYFAYATNSTEGHIQIIDSTDLIHWSTVGNALPNLPSWAVPGGTWAPSVLQVGGTFVLYYSAAVAGGGEECISAATAPDPQGPFVDSSAAPLVCQSGLGGSIDPSPFVDPDGRQYLEWKSNGGAGQPATIWSEQLDASGTGFAGGPPSRLLTADLGWEAGVIEAPDLILDSGHYVLFYSGNQWDSANYAVGVALCSGPLGPCAQPLTQPILASGGGMAGPGGESVFADASGSLWMAFDAWVADAVGYPNSRALYLRRLSFSGSTPVVGPGG
jgi:hypothetical protein